MATKRRKIVDAYIISAGNGRKDHSFVQIGWRAEDDEQGSISFHGRNGHGPTRLEGSVDRQLVKDVLTKLAEVAQRIETE